MPDPKSGWLDRVSAWLFLVTCGFVVKSKCVSQWRTETYCIWNSCCKLLPKKNGLPFIRGWPYHAYCHSCMIPSFITPLCMTWRWCCWISGVRFTATACLTMVDKLPQMAWFWYHNVTSHMQLFSCQGTARKPYCSNAPAAPSGPDGFPVPHSGPPRAHRS